MDFFQPKAFVISAPSGTGKTTIIKEAKRLVPSLTWSISCTTRQAREQEKNGIDYWFISVAAFERQIKEKAFIEWAKVHSNYYGTSWQELQKAKEEKNTLILDIDVQGALQLQDKKIDDVFFIFITPPSLATLEHRLVARNTETKESLAIRLKAAEEEMNHRFLYDVSIVNDSLDNAVIDFLSYILQQSIVWPQAGQFDVKEIAKLLYTYKRTADSIPADLIKLEAIITDIYNTKKR